MSHQYSLYQLSALQRLADFRNLFYDEKGNVRTESLQKSINAFVELFCQNNFADSDYTSIQKKPEKYATIDQWIDQFDIETILKCITYYIWTNRSNKGYFVAKIKDRTLLKYLSRLNDILSKEYMHLKLQQRNAAMHNVWQKQNNLQQ